MRPAQTVVGIWEFYMYSWVKRGETYEFDCSRVEGLPVKACVVGPDAAGWLARYAKEYCGKRAFVLSDENTRKAAGDGLFSALSGAGKQITEKVYPGDPLDATQELGDEVKSSAGSADFLVAAGGGTLSDLAKYAGTALKRPVLLYPTAASMNGYTSGIVALKVRGLKRTLPCAPAEGVFADPAVCATAPRRMTAAGVADFLSKCSSSTDWRAGHLLRGGYFSEKPREFFEGTTEGVLCAAQRIGRGESGAYATVLKALMLSGFSMVVAGSSAPASGGEHLISHYLDMKSALYGTPHDLHGAQVGVATVDCLELWETLLSLDPASIDVGACIAAQPGEEEIRAWIDEDWGPAVAAEVHAQWREKALDDDALRAEIIKFKVQLAKNDDEIRKDLLPSAVIAKAIRGVGGPVIAEELTAPVEEYRKALRRARFIRNRFTVLDLAAELCLQ